MVFDGSHHSVVDDDFSDNYTWMYSIVVTTLVVLGAKDRVLLLVLDILCNLVSWILRRTSYSSPKGEQDPDSGFFQVICREISDLMISQFMGWFTLFYLVTSSTVTGADSFTTARTKVVVVLVCLQAGRALHRAFHCGFVEPHPVEAAHCAIMASCYVAFLCPGTSTVVALIAAAGEVGDLHRPFVRMLDLRGTPCYSRVRLKALAAGVAALALGRCLLPAVLVVLAVTMGHPESMSRPNLVLFFFCMTYTLAIGVVMTVVVADRFSEARSLRTLYLDSMRSSSKAFEFALAMTNSEEPACSKGRRADVWTIPMS